jgi:predicted nucleic acid-binding protein
MLDGRVDGATSTAVLEEVMHVELRTTALDLRGVAGLTYGMFTPLLPVTDEVMKLALELGAPELGSNDRVHVATCRVNGIDVIVSADRGFDSVTGLRRVDPLDEGAVAALVG